MTLHVHNPTSNGHRHRLSPPLFYPVFGLIALFVFPILSGCELLPVQDIFHPDSLLSKKNNLRPNSLSVTFATDKPANTQASSTPPPPPDDVLRSSRTEEKDSPRSATEAIAVPGKVDDLEIPLTK